MRECGAFIAFAAKDYVQSAYVAFIPCFYLKLITTASTFITR